MQSCWCSCCWWCHQVFVLPPNSHSHPIKSSFLFFSPHCSLRRTMLGDRTICRRTVTGHFPPCKSKPEIKFTQTRWSRLRLRLRLQHIRQVTLELVPWFYSVRTTQRVDRQPRHGSSRKAAVFGWLGLSKASLVGLGAWGHWCHAPFLSDRMFTSRLVWDASPNRYFRSEDLVLAPYEVTRLFLRPRTE